MPSGETELAIAASPTAEPHRPQNRLPAGTSDPHRGQLVPFDLNSPSLKRRSAARTSLLEGKRSLGLLRRRRSTIPTKEGGRVGARGSGSAAMSAGGGCPPGSLGEGRSPRALS